MREQESTDVLIIGAGIGGCITALRAAKKNCKVIIITRKASNQDTSTVLAQGGIIYRGDDDSPEKLAQDIEIAGAGRCNLSAVKHLAQEGPDLVKKILIDELGVPFDKDQNNKLKLTREGAHSSYRIIHCADKTGKYIGQALWQAVETNPNITIFENTTAIDLLTTVHHSLDSQDMYKPVECFGAYVLRSDPHRVVEIYAKETVLATGGLGKVYLYSTNNDSARGDGYAMAERAGASLVNMEYVQFHPTALAAPTKNKFLISEAVRGEGGEICDAQGISFTTKYHPQGSLAPRDIVSRAIQTEMLNQHQHNMYLDISQKPAEWIKSRFPTIYANCLEHKIDITKDPIPIVPAAHYSCGGVLVNKYGQTTIPRLRAVGEVSCTGLHGANRLASTSLLEAVVWGEWTGRDIAEKIATKENYYFPEVSEWCEKNEDVDDALLEQDWMIIKHTMWNYVGLVRGNRRLRRAQRVLSELQTEVEMFYRRASLTDQIIGLRNGLQAARAVLSAASYNLDSHGCHFREKKD